MDKLTVAELLAITVELRYASDEASVNKFNAAVDELLDRGELDFDVV